MQFIFLKENFVLKSCVSEFTCLICSYPLAENLSRRKFFSIGNEYYSPNFVFWLYENARWPFFAFYDIFAPLKTKGNSFSVLRNFEPSFFNEETCRLFSKK